MSELDPVPAVEPPVEPKGTPLPQDVIDVTGIATVEELAAVKADAAALPQVQADLAAKQVELADAQAQLAAQEAAKYPSVQAVQALIDQLENFRNTTLNEVLNPLMSRAMAKEELMNLPVLTLGISGGGG